MKIIAISQALALTLAVFGLKNTVAAESDTRLAAFSGAATGAPPAPWRVAALPGSSKPVTHFEVVDLDGQHVLRVQADKSYGNLIHAWKGGAHTLAWRWRLDKPLLRANLRVRGGDDVALKLCVAFDMPTARLSLGERAQLAVARALSHEALPAATLCYIWDHSLAVGTVLPNAFTARLRYLVVDSGESRLHQWTSHQRDLAADFNVAFGSESDIFPPVTAFVIGADADNTGDSTLGYLGDVLVTP